MIYLSGVVRKELLGKENIGLMITPRMGNNPDLSRTPWAADNGCFSAGAKFKLDDFYRFLDRQEPYRETCLFAVAPDVLGDADATEARSAPILPEIRRRGYKAAFVAQDGIKHIQFDIFDVLFIGGSTEFKLSNTARCLTHTARMHGIPVHMGRVNSEKRLRTAMMWGCGSADGTYLARAPDVNLPKIAGWFSSIYQAPNFCFAMTEPLSKPEGEKT